MTLAFFDEIFVINQKAKTERAQQVTKELNRIGCTNFTLFPAVETSALPDFSGGIYDKQRQKCCALSHLTIIKQAKEQGKNSILIFEDDAVFEDDFLTLLPGILDFLRGNPWDMFYFGLSHIKPPQNTGTDSIMKVMFGYTTHAYAIHAKFFDKAIKLLTDGSAYNKLAKHNPILKELGDDPVAVDVLYATMHAMHNVYCASPRLVYQRPDYSTLTGTFADYSNQLRDPR